MWHCLEPGHLCHTFNHIVASTVNCPSSLPHLLEYFSSFRLRRKTGESRLRAVRVKLTRYFQEVIFFITGNQSPIGFDIKVRMKKVTIMTVVVKKISLVRSPDKLKVLLNATAFPLWRAMASLWNRNGVSRGSPEMWNNIIDSSIILPLGIQCPRG